MKGPKGEPVARGVPVRSGPVATPSVRAILCTHSLAPDRKRQKRWTFSYEDLAALLGVKPRTVRLMVMGNRKRAPTLDPRSLEAICFAWARRQGWAQPPAREPAERPEEAA